jgi:hypothetical protein
VRREVQIDNADVLVGCHGASPFTDEAANRGIDKPIDAQIVDAEPDAHEYKAKLNAGRCDGPGRRTYTASDFEAQAAAVERGMVGAGLREDKSEALRRSSQKRCR